MPEDGSPPIVEIVFGSVAADLTTKAILYPLDTLKTKLLRQASPDERAADRRLSLGHAHPSREELALALLRYRAAPRWRSILGVRLHAHI